VFYDNINYFIQEYTVWEKVFTSEQGAINDFDDENFLQFLPRFFRSSIDANETVLSQLQWQYLKSGKGVEAKKRTKITRPTMNVKRKRK